MLKYVKVWYNGYRDAATIEAMRRWVIFDIRIKAFVFEQLPFPKRIEFIAKNPHLTGITVVLKSVEAASCAKQAKIGTAIFKNAPRPAYSLNQREFE